MYRGRSRFGNSKRTADLPPGRNPSPRAMESRYNSRMQNGVSPSRDVHADLLEERRIYYEGIALFNEGQFFEAHDTWEEAWNLTRDRRRERFYRALIQSSVVLELLRRGRAVGVRQVFVTSQELFEGLPETFMGLLIPRHIDHVRRAIEPALVDLETRHIQIDPARLFRIELEYDPFSESRNGEAAELPR